MSKLYDRLAQLRDEIHDIEEFTYANDIFLQLIANAFNNQQHPDELPEQFKIYNVMIYTHQMEALMKRIGLDVTVKLCGRTNSFGSNFYITQNVKET